MKIKNKKVFVISISAILLIGAVLVYAYDNQKKYELAMENQYNMAFYEVIDYVQNVETFLAKSLISSTPEHGADTLTQVWREANLANAYITQLPLGNEELSQTSKFLNQVSEYSFALSRDNIYNEPLTEEDFNNLKDLHNYSIELENNLNQLALDMQSGYITWNDLQENRELEFAQEVGDFVDDSSSNIKGNFENFAGLIYDGAFSEHMTNVEKVGLTGDDIDENAAKEKIYQYISEDKIEEITSHGLVPNGNIPAFDFSVKLKEIEETASISISQKGGHLVLFNANRDVSVENLSQEEANLKGKEYLANCGFENMVETYYLKQGGIVTINYAYEIQNGDEKIIAYSDLIKVKVALDNGEILGVETTGYLNSHTEREDLAVNITMEDAKSTLNPDLEILDERLAIIPTDWKTELLCYEFKGKVNDSDFLVYINAKDGKEEDVLVILETPNGTLTM